MSGLDWNKLNQQKAALESKLSKGGGGVRAKFWKPKSGPNKIRVMKGWTEKGDFSGQFWREIAQHWNVSEDQKGPILCPKNTPYLSGNCPICALVEELKKDKGNAAAQQTVKEIRAKTAYLLNVVDRSDAQYTAQDVAEFKEERPDADVPFEVGDVKVQVYACPSTVFNQILSTIQTNQVDVTDPESGHDLTIKKTGKGLTTNYETNIIIKPSTAPAVEKLPVLSEIGFTMNYDEMVGLLQSGVGSSFAGALPASSALGAPSGALGAPSSSEDEQDDGEALRASMKAALKG